MEDYLNILVESQKLSDFSKLNLENVKIINI
jgi:hypothetical protein